MSSLTVTCIRKHSQLQFYVVDVLVHGHIVYISRVATGSGCRITVELSVRIAQYAGRYPQRILH